MDNTDKNTGDRIEFRKHLSHIVETMIREHALPQEVPADMAAAFRTIATVHHATNEEFPRQGVVPDQQDLISALQTVADAHPHNEALVAIINEAKQMLQADPSRKLYPSFPPASNLPPPAVSDARLSLSHLVRLGGLSS